MIWFDFSTVWAWLKVITLTWVDFDETLSKMTCGLTPHRLTNYILGLAFQPSNLATSASLHKTLKVIQFIIQLGSKLRPFYKLQSAWMIMFMRCEGCVVLAHPWCIKLEKCTYASVQICVIQLTNIKDTSMSLLNGRSTNIVCS